MENLAFQGDGLALSPQGLADVSATLGVLAPEVWTVLAVETSGCGFMPDRRPVILFEQHIFHRLTGGKYDDGNISDPSPGGYGPRGVHQYDRLNAAVAMDRRAALQSASWGVGQTMGMNYRQAGFTDVESMVAAMSGAEDAQLAAMAAFLISNQLDGALQNHDWKSFARGYNGPNYAINQYDVRLNGEYRKYSSGCLPDLQARAVQLYLTYLGYSPGAIDGIPGVHTLSALAEFQTQQGIPANTQISDDTVAQLRAALSVGAALGATAG